MLLNPTFAGTALTWAAQSQSAVEAFVTSTTASTITGGIVLASGYAVTLGGSIEFAANRHIPEWTLGASAAGVVDSIVLGVQNIVSSGNFYGTLEYHEAL